MATEIYNVAVKSKFGLFMEEELEDVEADMLVEKAIDEQRSREEALRKEKEEAKKKAIKEAKRQAQLAKKQAKEVVANKNQGDSQRPTRGQDQRGRGPRNNQNRGGPGGARRPIINRFDQDGNAQTGNDGDMQQREFSGTRGVGRPFNRGAGRGRGGRGRGAISGEAGRGREFERHSGSNTTGVKHMDKREGTGSYNWGSVNDDIQATKEADESAVVDEVAAPETAEVVESSEQGQEEAKDKGKQQMTMEQWKAQKAQVLSASKDVAADKETEEQKKSRKANDGQNVFSGMNVYRKPVAKEENEDSEDEEEIKAMLQQELEARKASQVNVKIRFTRPERDARPPRNAERRDQRSDRDSAEQATNKTGGEGERETGRPQRGRGGPAGASRGRGRGNATTNSTATKVAKEINVNDEGEFPSLGGR